MTELSPTAAQAKVRVRGNSPVVVVALHPWGVISRRRDCHFDDTPCLSALIYLAKTRGGAIE